MACPYFSTATRRNKEITEVSVNAEKSAADAQEGFCSIQSSESDLTYRTYLQLDKILGAQFLRSSNNGSIPIHDEHLFIITHQAFELWFRQVLHEVNSVRNILTVEYLEERNSLCVISRLNRVIAILKLCCDQFGVLETMTPQDFLDFRDSLEGGSGFQSLQFRLMEIRLGVIDELRVSYNRKHFMHVFTDDERKQIKEALSEPSLLHLIDDWLSRTPGLKLQTFDFWNKFKVSVHAMLEDMNVSMQEEKDADVQEHKRQLYQKTSKSFKDLFDENHHNELLKRNERRFTYHALQGALMIFFYRDEPRFHLPFQLLQSLMELDSQFMKLRYNHASMVQRMVGSKIGTGGSSGYLYLRSTCSDRYKIFLDLLNMATYLVPRDRIPPLSFQMKKSLSIHDRDIPPCALYRCEDSDSGYQMGSVSGYPITEENVSDDSRSLPSPMKVKKKILA